VSQEVVRSSFDSERRGSLGSVLKDNAITEESGKDENDVAVVTTPPVQDQPKQSADEMRDAKDILAEMEAFQREIDDLKKKFDEGR
jgi:hypothetical protein